MFSDILKNEFPTNQPILQVKGNIELNSEAPSTVEKEKIGLLLFTGAKNNCLHVRNNGFAYVNLNKTYTGWDVFKPQAEKYFSNFFDFFQPKEIKRISLRYINRIELPLGIKNLHDYFTTLPQVDNRLPSTLTNMLMQVRIPNPTYQAEAIITQTVVKEVENRTDFIFDIDVLKNVSYRDNLDLIWQDFEVLRRYKNEVFFWSLTDKASELFN